MKKVLILLLIVIIAILVFRFTRQPEVGTIRALDADITLTEEGLFSCSDDLDCVRVPLEVKEQQCPCKAAGGGEQVVINIAFKDKWMSLFNAVYETHHPPDEFARCYAVFCPQNPTCREGRCVLVDNEYAN